jgi:hypothetical protein
VIAWIGVASRVIGRVVAVGLGPVLGVGDRGQVAARVVVVAPVGAPWLGDVGQVTSAVVAVARRMAELVDLAGQAVVRVEVVGLGAALGLVNDGLIGAVVDRPDVAVPVFLLGYPVRPSGSVGRIAI